MIPVLAVDDPEAARTMLARVFGFTSHLNGFMKFGNQSVAVVPIGAVPNGMMQLRLDHVAFSVADVDQAYFRFMEQGGKLARSFTPDGPKDIPDFWDHGVRFVFFDGPDGWPFEFCMKKGSGSIEGHDHFAIRFADITKAIQEVSRIGGTPIAYHRLGNRKEPVEVQFMALGRCIFEVFAEGPYHKIDSERGWIGLLPK